MNLFLPFTIQRRMTLAAYLCFGFLVPLLQPSAALAQTPDPAVPITRNKKLEDMKGLSVFTTNADGEATGTELADERETSTGAFVPVNNDNDDYDFSARLVQKIDVNDTDGVVGENDLIKIVINKAEPGANYKPLDRYQLSFEPDIIKVWKNAEKQPGTGADPSTVQSGVSTFDNDTDTTLWIEGLAPGTTTLRLCLGANGTTPGVGDRWPLVDEIKITVYAVKGPCYVPGYTKYTYAVTGLTQKPEWDITGGSATAQPDNVTREVLWASGPVRGHVRVTPAEGFTCDREVYVVQIKLKPGPKTAPQNGENWIGTGGTPVQSDDTAIDSNPAGYAMACFMTVESVKAPLARNGAERGLTFMKMGFIQNIEVENRRGTFTAFNPALIWRHQMEAWGDILDCVNGGQPPWYDDTSKTAQVPNTSGTYRRKDRTDESEATDVALSAGDHPAVDVIPALQTNDPQSANPNDVEMASSMDLVLNFQMYFAVTTADPDQGPKQLFVQRASSSWATTAKGTIDVNGVWTGNVPANSSPKHYFDEVQSGIPVPVAETPIANKWADKVSTNWEKIH